MKKILSLCLFILIFSALFSQNILIWDKDAGYTVNNPDTGLGEGIEVSIAQALEDNGITPEIVTTLPTDLSIYDAIFATVGIWCAG